MIEFDYSYKRYLKGRLFLFFMTNPEREMQKACSIPVFTQGPQARCLRMRIQLVRETDFVLSPIGSRKKALIVDSDVVLNGGEVDGGKWFGNLVFLGTKFI